MTDNLTPEERRKTMRAVKGKGTGLERRLFGMLAGMRLRGWKRNVDRLPGKPDVVFPERRIAIFVDGCFWHGCPICERKLPETNRSYWERKISGNVERDKRNMQALVDDGWQVIRIWGHEMRDATAKHRAGLRIRTALAAAGGSE